MRGWSPAERAVLVSALLVLGGLGIDVAWHRDLGLGLAWTGIGVALGAWLVWRDAPDPTPLATANAIRALVRDTTRPVRDRLTDLEALAARLEGED